MANDKAPAWQSPLRDGPRECDRPFIEAYLALCREHCLRIASQDGMWVDEMPKRSDPYHICHEPRYTGIESNFDPEPPKSEQP